MAPSVTAGWRCAGRGKKPLDPEPHAESASSRRPQRDSPVSKIHVISSEAEEGPLSPREIEVVTWLAQGKQVQDAATILGISFHTATTHLTNAMRKLGICNRAELTYEAIRRGYVPCPCPAHAGCLGLAA